MASEHEEADPRKTTGVPRLSIAIVLLWTAASAGLLAFYRPMIDRVPVNFVVFTLAFTSAMCDVTSEEDYDWLHWMGVASLVTLQIMQELFYWRM